MANSKCPPCKKGAPGWLLTFGDMMSLLLTFFILLISMSTMDKVKFKDAAGSLKDAFGIQRIQQVIPLPTGENLIATEFQQELILVSLKEKLAVILENNTDAGEAELIALDEGFLLRMDRKRLLEPDSHKVRADAKPILLQMATLIKDLPNLVRVEGHTSDAPAPHPYSSNWELSSFEAAAIVNFFATEGNIDPKKLQVRGMSQYVPVASNETKEGRAKNHRLEIMVSRETRPSVQQLSPDDADAQSSTRIKEQHIVPISGMAPPVAPVTQTESPAIIP